MNPTARQLMGEDEALGETGAYLPTPTPSPSGVPCDEPAPRVRDRYSFGSGTRPLEGYTIKRAVGRGGFGEVYYAVSDAGKDVALKLLTRNIDIERRGVQQCMNLKSPHLITVYDMKTSDEGDTFVVMEYVSGPSLAQILADHPQGLPMADVRMWLKGLVAGVGYLHDHGIVHRDLKPANLFLEEGVVKIGDYGLSKAIAASQELGHSTSVGTCHYMAPEISTGKYQRPIDIYAIGVILYEMITGRVPFGGETAQEVLMKHLTALPDLSPLSEPFKSIIGRALAKDPARRQLTIVEMLTPEDRPAEPSVRIIGDARSNPVPDPSSGFGRSAVAPMPSAPPEPEVHRIGPEESVLYIGPDTLPPAPPRRAGRMRRLWNAARATRPVVARAMPASWSPPARRAAAKQPLPTVSQLRAMQAPIAPPPLPSPRIRLAELATSMLMAVPLTVILGLPTAALIGLRMVDEGSNDLVGLIVLALLGCWAVLVAAKSWEGHKVDASTKRLVMGVVGVGVAGALVALIAWGGVRPDRADGLRGRDLVELAGWWSDMLGMDRSALSPLSLAATFGLAFAAGPWDGLTARDRKARLRFWPVMWMGVVAWLLASFLPVPQAWTVAVVVLVSLVAAIVSPWSAEAAAYTRHRGRAA